MPKIINIISSNKVISIIQEQIASMEFGVRREHFWKGEQLLDEDRIVLLSVTPDYSVKVTPIVDVYMAGGGKYHCEGTAVEPFAVIADIVWPPPPE